IVSGLYDLPGFSATAIAAACAKRFELPMTNVSKEYFGLRRESLSRRDRSPWLSRYGSRSWYADSTLAASGRARLGWGPFSPLKCCLPYGSSPEKPSFPYAGWVP